MAFVSAPLLHSWFRTGSLQISDDFEPVRLIGAVLMVGITEELVFRGFLLNGLLQKMKKELAIATDAILFTLIHYPIWIYFGFDLMTILTSSVAVLVVSVVFALSFIKTKTILAPIAMHMVYNLLFNLFSS